MSRKPKAPYTHLSDGSPCWTKDCSRNRPKVVKVKPVSTTGLSSYETEQVGISVELAVADAFQVPVNPNYRNRGRQELVDHVITQVKSSLTESNVPTPVQHIAEDQNPVDFILAGGKTLSVKSNMRAGSRISPQNIGQPTSVTFWKNMSHLAPNIDTSKLSYDESKRLFKRLAQDKTKELLTAYWKNLFDCDYLLYVGNVLGKSGDDLSSQPNVKVFSKKDTPVWDASKFSFTKTPDTWNESCTLKYDGVTIGEWQVHNNRDCFKFRFDLRGIIQKGLI